jgi:CheY-like chemotaxis protein
MKNTNVEKPDLSYMNALVVDDFQPNRSLTEAMLGKYKIRVDVAESGQEALDLIKKGQPAYHFIFMDYMMPDMDGIESTRKIRSLDTEYAKNVPIIALTGAGTEGNESMFMDNGFLAVLYKPLSFERLDVFLKFFVERGQVDP